MNGWVVQPDTRGRWVARALLFATFAFGLGAVIGQCGCTPQAPTNGVDSLAYTLEQKACVDEAKDAGTGHVGADACHARVKAKWEAR